MQGVGLAMGCRDFINIVLSITRTVYVYNFKTNCVNVGWKPGWKPGSGTFSSV